MEVSDLFGLSFFVGVTLVIIFILSFILDVSFRISRFYMHYVVAKRQFEVEREDRRLAALHQKVSKKKKDKFVSHLETH
jgi:cell shape-determining protein MreC